MLVVVVMLLAFASVPLLRGRLSRLAAVELRHPWLLLVALAVQVVVTVVVPDGQRALLAAAHVASYVVAGGFVWLNRTVPGVLVAAAGGALNGVAIAVNGGTLPASPTALERAGISPEAGEFANSAALEHPRLAWLGDVFWVPSSWPFANVFSVGDVVLVLGIAYGVHRICGSRLPWSDRSRETGVLDSRHT